LSIVVGTRTAFINVTIAVVVEGVTELRGRSNFINTRTPASTDADLSASFALTEICSAGLSIVIDAVTAFIDGSITVVVQGIASLGIPVGCSDTWSPETSTVAGFHSRGADPHICSAHPGITGSADAVLIDFSVAVVVEIVSADFRLLSHTADALFPASHDAGLCSRGTFSYI
jgi:hypothetical protein